MLQLRHFRCQAVAYREAKEGRKKSLRREFAGARYAMVICTSEPLLTCHCLIQMCDSRITCVLGGMGVVKVSVAMSVRRDSSMCSVFLVEHGLSRGSTLRKWDSSVSEQAITRAVLKVCGKRTLELELEP